ncbi:MAG TPA: orotidine-5'-phosphate decarboxylase [Clostridiales bacterium]|nr:orotidine-5'-phosphate decarboxylase [Clostridiales bacterium]
MIIDRLMEKIDELKNPTVIGLDTRLDYLPDYILEKWGLISGKATMDNAAEAVLEFNKTIVDNIYDIVPAVKIQIACYEMLGLPGLSVFNRTVDYCRDKGLIVIGDAKRNDIGSTAREYARAFLGETQFGDLVLGRAFPVDFLTVNPYLGYDGVQPFIECCKKYNKGIFVLAKTSNASSCQIQDLKTQDERVFQAVARLIHEWGRELVGKNGYSCVGAVVGATYPEQARILRASMPHTFFLVPGYGAQGGKAEDIALCFDNQGRGAIVNASRSILCSYRADRWKDKFTSEEFGQAARAEALRMRDDITRYL